MGNNLEKEVNVLRQAMLNEVEGMEFYRLSAEKFGPSATKDALLQLAKEEESHVEYLKDLSERILNKTIDFDPEKLKKEVPSPEIFTWNNVEEADEDMIRLAVTVFSVGMGMEKDSVAFYEKAKEEAETAEVKELFDILIAWEKAHYLAFEKQYRIFEQEWWNQQNFAPF